MTIHRGGWLSVGLVPQKQSPPWCSVKISLPVTPSKAYVTGSLIIKCQANEPAAMMILGKQQFRLFAQLPKTLALRGTGRTIYSKPATLPALPVNHAVSLKQGSALREPMKQHTQCRGGGRVMVRSGNPISGLSYLIHFFRLTIGRWLLPK